MLTRMAIPQLTDEQIRTMSVEEKDRWWLTTVFRGDMPQLTIRATITGFLLGGLLSATNLYVGAKTGWTLGVGLTSVILAYVAFRTLSRIGLGRDFTILENNAMQSIATAAGYMTSPLVASFAAYMMMTEKVVPWHQIILWNIVLSILGVLIAFPMKRRFINDEQQPFPEGRACGVVLDMLYQGTQKAGKTASGSLQAAALLVAALVAGGLQFCLGEAYQKYLQVTLLGRSSYFYLSDKLDGWYLALAQNVTWIPTKIMGVPYQQLGLAPKLDVAMIGAGGLMGTRVANSLMLGMLVNFVIIAPIMINAGEIPPSKGAFIANIDGSIKDFANAEWLRRDIVNKWALWWGVAMMVAASLVSLFAKPQVIISAFAGLLGKKKPTNDVLGHIELPLWVTYVGVPIFTAIAVWMGHDFFGVQWVHGLLAIPLIIILTLIAVNSTALTGTTPGGALSKITQFTIGSLDRTNPATNLMTAGMTAEVAVNASNLLMDIKPGYMLGAKPRQQAIGHIVGIFSGAIASTPLFFIMFLNPRKEGVEGANKDVSVWDVMNGAPPASNLESLMVDDKFGFPGALQWKGVAQLIADGVSSLPKSALIAMAVATVVAIAFEIARMMTRGKFPLSALAIGLGVVLPPESTLMMWAGSMFFWAMKAWLGRRESTAKLLFVDSHESICAGLIAGAALIGIGEKLVETFLLK
jgi:uncharacterized oligopeptide transporter (OPT) family protein